MLAKAVTLAITFSVLTSSVARAQTTLPGLFDEPQEASTPELSGGRIAGELAVGALVGAGGIMVGAVVGAGLEQCGPNSSEFCGLGGALVGGYAGYVLAAPLGVYAIGQSGDQTGSLGATYLGSALGGAAGLSLAIVSDGSELGGVALLLGPLVGSVIGFNATRGYDRDTSPARMGALLQLDDGELAVAVPMPTMSRGVSGDASAQLPLVAGKW